VAFLLCLASALTFWSWSAGSYWLSFGRAVCSRGQCSISWFWIRHRRRFGIILRMAGLTTKGTLRLLMATTLPLRHRRPLFLFPALLEAFGASGARGGRDFFLTVHHAYLIRRSEYRHHDSHDIGRPAGMTPRTLPARWPEVPWSRGCCHFCWQVALRTARLRLPTGSRPKDQNLAPPMVSARPSS